MQPSALSSPWTFRFVVAGAAALLHATAVLGVAATINVPGDQPTIQAAINVAVSGDTIVVAPGTYTENLTLNKSITLQGAKVGVSGCGRVVGAPNPAVESVITAGSGILLTLTTGSAGSVIDGFAFSGGTRGIESVGGPLNGLIIRNNHFGGFTSAATFLNDPGLDVTVHANEMNASTKVGGGGIAHFDQDNFDGLHFTSNCVINGATGTGMFVDGNHNVGESASRDPLIDGNLISGNQTGMNLGSRAFGEFGAPATGPYAGTISNNIFRDNLFDGLQGGMQHCLITNNQFVNNGRHGLALTAFNAGPALAAADRGAQFCTITGNQVLSNGFTQTGWGISCSAIQATNTISTNHINNNFIIGNRVGARYEGGEVVDFENNWWGHPSGPFDISGLNPVAGCASGSPYVGNLINAAGLGELIDPLTVGIDYCPFNDSIASVSLNGPAGCVSGSTVTVTLDLSNVEKGTVGGQFFLQYNQSVLDFDSAVPGTGDFTVEIYEVVNEGLGTIDYAVGVPVGGGATTANQTMATFTFNVLQNVCSPTANLVTFRAHTPPSMLTNPQGSPLIPLFNNLGPIKIDTTPPVISCPANVTVQCNPSDLLGLPGSMLGTATGGVEIEYNNFGPEVPTNQAYLKAQITHTNANGMQLTFSNALLPPYNFPGVTWATIFGDQGQFGLDMVLPAPTYTGPPAIPFLNAYDNTNNNCPNATVTPNFIWAINDYNNLGGPAVGTCIINSLFRSAGLAPNAVTITKNILSRCGTVYTVQIGGILQSDNLIHWFNPVTPDSPVSNFLLNGKIYFDGTLTYDSLGDPGNDGDFYSGTINLSFNSPYTGANAVGIPTASDNCDPQPAVTYTDVVGGTACDTIITRTWKATDSCGNFSTCVQTIHVVDTTAPVFAECCPLPPINVNADVGNCSASYASVAPVVPTATDACSTANITYLRSDSQLLTAPYPSGVTTITWTATDACGNFSICQQVVTVNPINTMMVDIAYDGGFAGTNFTRCIRFELFTCPSTIPVIVDQNVNFVNGQALNVAVNVPCGLYSCVTARDRKHTLRKTDGGFGIVGTVYDANFTSGDALVGGNLNDDPYIDILDFGIFIGQYNSTPSPSTPCGYVGNHADISGNGVVTVGDYTFITNNFLQTHEANCCGAPRLAAGGSGGEGGPITRISVKELMRRGMRDVIAGDLNQDGWVDTADVQFFMSGGSTGGSR